MKILFRGYPDDVAAFHRPNAIVFCEPGEFALSAQCAAGHAGINDGLIAVAIESDARNDNYSRSVRVPGHKFAPRFCIFYLKGDVGDID